MNHIIVDGVVFDTKGDLAKKVRKLLESHSKADLVGRVHGEFVGFESDIEAANDKIEGLLAEINELEEDVRRKDGIIKEFVDCVENKGDSGVFGCDECVADALIGGLEELNRLLSEELEDAKDLAEVRLAIIENNLEHYQANYESMNSAVKILVGKYEEEADELRAEITRVHEEAEDESDELRAHCTELRDIIEHISDQVEPISDPETAEARMSEIESLRSDNAALKSWCHTLETNSEMMRLNNFVHWYLNKEISDLKEELAECDEVVDSLREHLRGSCREEG